MEQMNDFIEPAARRVRFVKATTYHGFPYEIGATQIFSLEDAANLVALENAVYEDEVPAIDTGEEDGPDVSSASQHHDSGEGSDLRCPAGCNGSKPYANEGSLAAHRSKFKH